jgi:hypothetical protein
MPYRSTSRGEAPAASEARLESRESDDGVASQGGRDGRTSRGILAVRPSAGAAPSPAAPRHEGARSASPQAEWTLLRLPRPRFGLGHGGDRSECAAPETPRRAASWLRCSPPSQALPRSRVEFRLGERVQRQPDSAHSEPACSVVDGIPLKAGSVAGSSRDRGSPAAPGVQRRSRLPEIGW